MEKNTREQDARIHSVQEMAKRIFFYWNETGKTPPEKFCVMSPEWFLLGECAYTHNNGKLSVQPQLGIEVCIIDDITLPDKLADLSPFLQEQYCLFPTERTIDDLIMSLGTPTIIPEGYKITYQGSEVYVFPLNSQGEVN